MDDYSTTACIVWPARWPKNIKDAHCTVLYLGEIEQIPAKADQILEIIHDINVAFPSPGQVETDGIAYFGDNKELVVVKMKDHRLFPVQFTLAYELSRRLDVKSASTFPHYAPHVTVGKKEEVLKSMPFITAPKSIFLGPMELWWGNDYMVG